MMTVCPVSDSLAAVAFDDRALWEWYDCRVECWWSETLTRFTGSKVIHWESWGIVQTSVPREERGNKPNE
jgi:hypothetical protein